MQIFYAVLTEKGIRLFNFFVENCMSCVSYSECGPHAGRQPKVGVYIEITFLLLKEKYIIKSKWFFKI